MSLKTQPSAALLRRTRPETAAPLAAGWPKLSGRQTQLDVERSPRPPCRCPGMVRSLGRLSLSLLCARRRTLLPILLVAPPVAKHVDRAEHGPRGNRPAGAETPHSGVPTSCRGSNSFSLNPGPRKAISQRTQEGGTRGGSPCTSWLRFGRTWVRSERCCGDCELPDLPNRQVAAWGVGLRACSPTDRVVKLIVKRGSAGKLPVADPLLSIFLGAPPIDQSSDSAQI